MEAPVHGCRIATNVEAARDQRLVGLDVPADLLALRRVPGQYVIAGRPGGQHGLFVLCSPAVAAKPWELLVRAGAPAADAIAALPPGSSIEVSAPRGRGFPMESVLGTDKDVVLVCAGAGIAALRPVLHAIRERRSRLDRVRLYHGVPSRAHAAFGREIDAFRKDGLTARLCISREDAGPDDAKGYVQDVMEEEGTHLAESVVLAAGPPDLVRRLREGLPKIGLAAGAVLTNFA